jgi:predicted kinase
MKKILLLLRGLPGAGKTSLAEALEIRAVCSADDYVTRKGVYNWKPETTGISHEWCQRKCRRFMKKQIDKIVVANTLTSERELKPYYDLARQFGYTVYSVVVENRHEGVNSHDVPEETLEKMRNRLTNNIIL